MCDKPDGPLADGPLKTLIYDQESERYYAKFSSSTFPASLVIIEVVAAIKDQDPTELKPLYEVVNPEALDELFSIKPYIDHRGDFSVSFHYEGYEVVAHNYGIIEIQELSKEE